MGLVGHASTGNGANKKILLMPPVRVSASPCDGHAPNGRDPADCDHTSKGGRPSTTASGPSMAMRMG